jgi:hypothetical protein
MKTGMGMGMGIGMGTGMGAWYMHMGSGTLIGTGTGTIVCAGLMSSKSEGQEKSMKIIDYCAQDTDCPRKEPNCLTNLGLSVFDQWATFGRLALIERLA